MGALPCSKALHRKEEEENLYSCVTKRCPKALCFRATKIQAYHRSSFSDCLTANCG